MTKNGAIIWLQKFDQLKKEMEELKLVNQAQSNTILVLQEENVQLKNRIAETDRALSLGGMEVVIVNQDPVELSEATAVELGAEGTVEAEGTVQAPIDGVICESCGNTIKGPPSQMKAHKENHCGIKPPKVLKCPICKIPENYKGLRYHLQFYKNDHKISRATKRRKNHRYYTVIQHQNIREKMVKKAGKLREANKAANEFTAELNAYLDELVSNLPKRDDVLESEQSDDEPVDDKSENGTD